jgi:hypothetical protein
MMPITPSGTGALDAARQFRADRVGQVRNRFEAARHRLDTLLREFEPIEHRGREARVLRGGEVGRICGQQFTADRAQFGCRAQ